MAVTNDILRTYRAPRQVVADLLGMGQREDRAIVYLMAGCLLVFVAQLPRLSRKAHLEADTLSAEEIAQGWSVFDRNVAYEFLSWMVVWPLLFYAIAALIYGVRKAMGRHSTAYTTRLALFWAFLAAAPLGLLYGLTAGFVGPGLQSNLVGGLWLGAFFVFTWAGLGAGERHAS